MRRLFVVAVVPLLASLISAAQSPSALNPPSPQTARQALIEMFFGEAANHLEKHLPDVTRKTLQRMDSGDGRGYLTEFSLLASQAKAGGAKLETFDTGPTLLTTEDPRGRGNEKVEITVERDDLVGDEDQIELGLHMTRGGKEETLPFIPHFTFVMKTEADVWRLNEISVTVRLPLADPDFLKSIEDRQRPQNEAMTIWSLQTVTSAEKSYNAARGSYACTLSALGAADQSGGENRPVFFDRQLASGKKGGYVYVITGCDALHYKVVAEPALPDSGQRAFCSDEGGAIRASADGKAATCLSSGENVAAKMVGDYSVGLNAGSQTAAASAVPPPAQPGRTAPQRIRVSAGVSQGLLASRVEPTYPDKAMTARIQGRVVLKVVISKTGDVVSLALVSGDPLLAPAAIDAVKQWKYKPYLLNGNPVEVDTQVTVNFTLGP